MKPYLKLIDILFLPLAFVIYYAYSPVQLPPPGWKLSKLTLEGQGVLLEQGARSKGQEEEQGVLLGQGARSKGQENTNCPRNPLVPCPLPLAPEKTPQAPDTASQRILFFGDSMVEGLLRRMNSYAFANGHQVTNVVWYGSSTELWAQTDTLHYFMEKVKPTFVMISIGSNEQFIKDVAGREASIRHILMEVGKTPFVWIGVPAWRSDTGINDLTERIVGKQRYFDSRGLTLQRGSDRRHPTFSAAGLWMDSIARWMASPATAYPIRMDKPTDKKRHAFKTYALQPVNP